MSVCYLEVDDEITSAIARIRAVRDGEAIIVVPPGSRIATSRINFKLLAREGAERRLNVAAVSDDPAVRALAISAGLPTYDSIAAAEKAMANFREQDRRLAGRLGETRPARDPAATTAPAETPPAETPPAATPPTETRVLKTPLPEQLSLADAAPAPAARDEARSATAVLGAPLVAQDESARADSRSATRQRNRRRRVSFTPLLVVALIVLLMAGVAAGAYAFLPTATITLRPATITLAPGPFTVIADPNVAVVDAVAGVVPAQTVELPLQVSGTFPATGIQAREMRATGTVRLRSENTLNDVPVPADTLISTGGGVEFLTHETVTVPRASFATGPTTADVRVRAVKVGPRGNVAAGSITQLPPALASQLITVRNPQATTGGRRIEESVIAQDDYDDAIAALTGQLDAALSAALADPASVPRGLAVFPSTAAVESVRPDQAAGSLVGTVASQLILALDAVGRVTAVNETLVDDVAGSRLRESVPAGHQLVGGPVASGRTAGVVSGNQVTYEVSPSALSYRPPEHSELITQVRGKTLSEAEAILGRYGMVEIVLWPEFIDRLPDQGARISLTIAPPTGS